jgi:hypothetical protein
MTLIIRPRRRGFPGLLVIALFLISTTAYATPNDKFVGQVYTDLLHRTPAPAEVAGFANPLNSMSITRSGVAMAVLNSDEFLTIETNDFFNALLHRPPLTTELGGYVAVLKATSFEQAQATLAGMPEYFSSRGGSTNNGYLDALYSDLLHRVVDPAARTAFGGALTGGTLSREQVAATVLHSFEYDTLLVGGYYSKFLGRPTDAGAGAYATELQNGVKDQQVIAQIISSQEYFDRAQTIPEPACAAFALVGALALSRRRHWSWRQS